MLRALRKTRVAQAGHGAQKQANEPDMGFQALLLMGRVGPGEIQAVEMAGEGCCYTEVGAPAEVAGLGRSPWYVYFQCTACFIKEQVQAFEEPLYFGPPDIRRQEEQAWGSQQT